MLEGANSFLVSIVVPVYNVEKFIEECLNSVLAQTYQSYEIVLVNDGSTDNSLEICCKFQKQDSRVKVFSKVNGGLSSARNYGITKSTGEYIIFLDPDDYWINPAALEQLVKVANETKCDIVRGEFKEVDQRGEDLLVRKIPERLYKISGKICSSIEFLHGPISTGNFVWLFLIKKKTLDECVFNEEQKYQEDIEFNIRYFAVARRCVYIPLIFYAYRKRDNSLTSTLSIKNLKYSFLLGDVFYEYSKKTNDKDISIHYLRNAIMMYYWTIETISYSPLYQQRNVIINQLGLVKRKNKTLEWIKESNEYFPLLILFSPNVVIDFFRMKNSIIKYYAQCKKKIKKLCGML